MMSHVFMPSDEHLKVHGFIQLEPESFEKSEFNRAQIITQWKNKDVILSLEQDSDEVRTIVFDKLTPGFSLRLKSQRELLEILHWLEQGKTINYLMQLEQERREKEVIRMEELRENPPYLEDYRYNNIGGSHFLFTSKPDLKIFMPYQHHLQLAFRYTMNDLAKLENAKDTVHTGVESHTAISLWFLTLESYINALIKLCCVKKNEDFGHYKRQTLPGRLSSLLQFLEIDRKDFNKNKIIPQLDELCQFRNEIFHDRHFGEEIRFKHTSLSPIPIFNCQIDEIQAIKILVEIANMLRFAIDGLDTMPTVILHTHAVAWVHLSEVYQKIIQPYVTFILEKHHMRTRLRLEMEEPLNFRSTVFEKGDILCLVQVDQEPEFEFWLNSEQTSMGNNLYKGYMDSLNLKPDTLLFPKVTLV
ncbi:hypothetical protein HHL16_00225 [Pseudoflavitalea sp. G-6-1-2]|uniref:hypothetical protein n=1 Tax=Pseudoflavitalea sp. G-6-1-2 TaxID=2728841 RepID=UPI00146CE218|nr:hypothetical protein [Pseudoflavitalea sp. G-6-1-2]NML19270.1 hypothetical protein [Pseudoflavitalea sp. G-6-1-2]